MSGILDQLGLDPEDFEWRDLGLCRSIVSSPEDDVVFDRYESNEETAKATDEMCLHCPVVRQCFFAGADGRLGVWGGVYWNGAGKPDKNKNNHKTDEVWSRIHERVSGDD